MRFWPLSVIWVDLTGAITNLCLRSANFRQKYWFLGYFYLKNSFKKAVWTAWDRMKCRFSSFARLKLPDFWAKNWFFGRLGSDRTQIMARWPFVRGVSLHILPLCKVLRKIFHIHVNPRVAFLTCAYYVCTACLWFLQWFNLCALQWQRLFHVKRDPRAFALIWLHLCAGLLYMFKA